MTFAELGVQPELVSALARRQITVPTPIQVAALPVLQAGRDAYLHAEKGTGKTLAYLLPLFARLDTEQKLPQVVIVAPTHELAIQLQRQCRDLAQDAALPVRTLLLIGGTSLDRQLDKLKTRPHIVVGSSGRLLELIRMGKLKASVPGSGLGRALPGMAGSKYTQNRATIHLHGNNTVWISDGNVHQWITPADEITPYPKGVTVKNVPDMGTECDAGNRTPEVPGNSGCMTLFYTNAQSARLQFYHDHSMGITRLNVYAGEAGGYVITDAVEQDMINGTNVTGINGIDASGVPIPGTYKKVLPDIGIPLIIQDRTFVPQDTQSLFRGLDVLFYQPDGFRGGIVGSENIGPQPAQEVLG